MKPEVADALTLLETEHRDDCPDATRVVRFLTKNPDDPKAERFAKAILGASEPAEEVA